MHPILSKILDSRRVDMDESMMLPRGPSQQLLRSLFEQGTAWERPTYGSLHFDPGESSKRSGNTLNGRRGSWSFSLLRGPNACDGFLDDFEEAVDVLGGVVEMWRQAQVVVDLLNEHFFPFELLEHSVDHPVG